MSSFAGERLFDSGPHRFQIGGRSLRHTLHEPARGDGEHLASHGRRGRRITQRGALIADSPAELATLANAIETRLDGEPATLIDDLSRPWHGVVMLAFEPGPAQRLGPRFRMNYRIDYAQLT